jgi:hypothetical protein
VVGVRTTTGVIAVTDAVDELLPATGSGVPGLTDCAVFEMTVPSAVPALTFATIVIVALPPEGVGAENPIDRAFPVPPHTPPPVEEQEMNVNDAGRVSVMVIVAASSGPAFVTTME